MPPGFKYADAVKLLGGSAPAAKVVDNLLGGALSVATMGGSEAALSFFDAKAEMVRLGHVVTEKINERVRGLGRYDRSQRLQAAHSILVVTAFFEAFDAVVQATGLNSAELTRDDQIMLATGGTAGRDWLERLVRADIPAPSPEQAHTDLRRRLRDWYASVAAGFLRYLSGLAVWDKAPESVRRDVRDVLAPRLPDAGIERYEQAVRRLALDVPEFELWIRRTETEAMGRSLQTLESTLLRVTSGRDPDRHRAALARAYRAELIQPALSGASREVAMPTLGEAYVDPPFRAKAAGIDARPADESWWDTEPRTDLAAFLTGYLTTPQATQAPMLLLGQPGAGKSVLTRVLAARLPAADFMVVRVALREVPAEAEIQDQIEQGLRVTIGETVAWADLARGADGALPVILLDGFDELLQATGIHRSDYLSRVAAFQQREAVQGRPAAVIVTSRIAVADRARLPADSIAVRLDAFAKPHVARWLETWNAVTGSALSLDAVWQYPELAGQPLLLLMLALYDPAGSSLSDGFDPAELYERLLTEFADREVRRPYAGRPEADLPDLVQAELARLSIVAFAMFNRSRQWVTEAELDADLLGLGVEPSRPAPTEAFRSPLTASQELVGRFFFIQRAQAVQDGKTLQTYEFLHATFGEYLVARLIVQALRASAAASLAARAMPLHGQKPDDGMLKSLLGFTPLTVRGTVLSFVATLMRPGDRPAIRQWLVEVLRTAMIRPEPPSSAYRPVDKRVDHWMAMYSLNLVLLALACGEPLRASEVFTRAADPAGWMRNAALQWRAAVPSGMWLDTTATLTVIRTWAGTRRDVELRASRDGVVDEVDPLWSYEVEPDHAFDAGARIAGGFQLNTALTSMQLSNNLSDDVLRHAVEPLLSRMPEAVTTFVLHGPRDAESIGRSILDLWLASALDPDTENLTRAYARAADALPRSQPLGGAADEQVATRLFVALLGRDAARLAASDVLSWLLRVVAKAEVDPLMAAGILECLALTGATSVSPDDDDKVSQHLAVSVIDPEALRDLPAILRLRSHLALAELGLPEPAQEVIHPRQEFFDQPEIRQALAADRILRLRLENLPDRACPLTDQ